MHNFPNKVAVLKPGSREVVAVTPGDDGYQEFHGVHTLEEADALLEADGIRRPTDAERKAALAGSMFGWDVPGADPAYHAR